jgi:hypothetical protein
MLQRSIATERYIKRMKQIQFYGCLNSVKTSICFFVLIAIVFGRPYLIAEYVYVGSKMYS